MRACGSVMVIYILVELDRDNVSLHGAFELLLLPSGGGFSVINCIIHLTCHKNKCKLTTSWEDPELIYRASPRVLDYLQSRKLALLLGG